MERRDTLTDHPDITHNTCFAVLFNFIQAAECTARLDLFGRTRLS